MKLIFIVVLAILGVQNAASAEIDDHSTVLCVLRAVNDFGLDTFKEGIAWLRDLRTTTDNLINERRRCREIANERLQDICLTRWRAQVTYEGVRLSNDVRRFIGDDATQQFYNDFLSCFGVEPKQIV